MTDLRRRIVGVLLAAVSVTAFAATFVVGAALTRDCGVSPEALAFLRFVAVALAAVFLGERATAFQWLGALLVCASALVESRS